MFNGMATQNTEFLQDPNHQFWFSIDNLPTIQLNFPTAQWELLLTSTSSDREEVLGDFSFTQSDIEYSLANIGIKLSGNTSFRLPQTPSDPFVQANFTLDFDGGFLWQGNYKDWGVAHFSRITADWGDVGDVGDVDQASFEYKGKAVNLLKLKLSYLN
jgi:hypothetical protein